MFKEWKIWEKLRRDLERKPEDYDDMQVVCKYYFSFIMGLFFSAFGLLMFLASAIMMFRHNSDAAICFFMLSVVGWGYTYCYAYIMDEQKRNPKYRKAEGKK